MFTKRSYILKKNLQLEAAGLFKYVWPFSQHQELKGLNFNPSSTDSEQKDKINLSFYFRTSLWCLMKALKAISSVEVRTKIYFSMIGFMRCKKQIKQTITWNCDTKKQRYPGL